MYINFYDKFSVKLAEDNSLPAIFLKNKYRHYLSVGAAASDTNSLVLCSPDKLMAKELNFISKEAAFDEADFYIIDKRKNKLRFNFNGSLDVEKEFDINLFAAVFNSIILTKLSLSGIIPFHASSVFYKNSGIVFASWAGTGKTRMLLRFIKEGAEFVSDEWVFLRQDKLFTHFVSFEMANYDIKEFPQCANLSFFEKARMGLTFLNNFYGFRQVFSHLNLILRSKTFDLSGCFSNIRDGVELGQVIFLQSYSGESVKKIPVGWEILAEKIFQSFLRENRLFFHYYNLYKFTNLAKDGYLKNVDFEKEYKALVSGAIRRKECYLLLLPSGISYRGIDVRDVIN